VDVLELLSDTGLGKEMHSVVSQGRVEAIVTSKPKDRRLLIEEAAGLGKHRKRRRRAQLKLERTQDNLDRALDVEREARSRLRPLKRQAEAAELHERIERQTIEARWELARDAARARGARWPPPRRGGRARAARDEAQAALGAVAARRQAAEEALARRSSTGRGSSAARAPRARPPSASSCA
jgi:chromosome segregation protein